MKLQLSILTLVAVLVALSSASPPMVPGICKHSFDVDSLNPQKYFDKKWYVWKSHGGFLFQRSGSCSGQDAKMEGDKIELLAFQYQPLIGQYHSIKGEADAKYIQFKGLGFPVSYDFGVTNFTLNFNILGTDYDNWAAVYLCQQLLAMKIEMSWLMVRDRDTTPTGEQQEAMSSAISKIGFTLEDYRFKKNDNCGVDEPHL